MTKPWLKQILVTGGAGYVGAVLVPRLLHAGYRVRVLDWYLFGADVLNAVRDHPHLEQIKGDIRDVLLLQQALKGCDGVIHLACISNDPSAELNPTLTRQINLDAFTPLVRLAQEEGVRRFLYASSSSVYGVSTAKDVGETHALAPLTDYSRYKAMCEPILLQHSSDDFVPVIVRPATVCGYSPRLRLDLTVNILTCHAVERSKITVFGGSQLRPNIHISDLCQLYLQLLTEPDWRVGNQIFNAGYQNLSVLEIAHRVRQVVMQMRPHAGEVQIELTPSDDLRSYHISSRKALLTLGFLPRRTIEDAVSDLVTAFDEGRVPEPLSNPRYSNIRAMQTAQDRLLVEPGAAA